MKDRSRRLPADVVVMFVTTGAPEQVVKNLANSGIPNAQAVKGAYSTDRNKMPGRAWRGMHTIVVPEANLPLVRRKSP